VQFAVSITPDSAALPPLRHSKQALAARGDSGALVDCESKPVYIHHWAVRSPFTHRLDPQLEPASGLPDWVNPL
jgi:hypothetical protein